MCKDYLGRRPGKKKPTSAMAVSNAKGDQEGPRTDKIGEIANNFVKFYSSYLYVDRPIDHTALEELMENLDLTLNTRQYDKLDKRSNTCRNPG